MVLWTKSHSTIFNVENFLQGLAMYFLNKIKSPLKQSMSEVGLILNIEIFRNKGNSKYRM